MIKQEDRDTLNNLIMRGDIPRAADIYRKNTNRGISNHSLEKFIKGERKNYGDKPGTHQPEDMYNAIAQAIAERLQRAKRLQKLVDDIRESTIEAAAAAY